MPLRLIAMVVPPLNDCALGIVTPMLGTADTHTGPTTVSAARKTTWNAIVRPCLAAATMDSALNQNLIVVAT